MAHIVRIQVKDQVWVIFDSGTKIYTNRYHTTTVPVAPWEGYRGYEKEMKRAIMEISEVNSVMNLERKYTNTVSFNRMKGTF